MPVMVTSTTTLMCSFGAAPSVLQVLPTNKVVAPLPSASIMDFAPFVNIMPFGVCMSLANPTVASATAAALGVLTPMPCVPATSSPWVPGNPKVLVGTFPAVTNTCKLMCMWGGVIQVTVPGQFVTQV